MTLRPSGTRCELQATPCEMRWGSLLPSSRPLGRRPAASRAPEHDTTYVIHPPTGASNAKNFANKLTRTNTQRHQRVGWDP